MQALIARNLSLERKGSAILHRVDIGVRSGEIVWVEGPSGAGKTTLLRALGRLLQASSGVLNLDGVEADQIPPADWRARVNYLPTPHVPLGPTIRDDLLAPYRLKARRGWTCPNDSILRGELDDMGLDGLDLHRSTLELSQGQRARIALLRTILARPQVVLLDEPTANLDPQSICRVARRIGNYVRAGGAAVVAAHARPWGGVTRQLRIEGGRLGEVPS